MRIFATVVFSDLSGSTALYESLGNERASQAVTRLTRWMGDVVVGHGGRVVKELGDPEGLAAASIDAGVSGLRVMSNDPLAITVSVITGAPTLGSR